MKEKEMILGNRCYSILTQYIHTYTYIYLYICICVCIYITAHIISWHILPQFSSAWKAQYRNIFISFFGVERRGNIHGKAIFAKHSVWDVWQSSEYTTEVCCNKGEFNKLCRNRFDCKYGEALKSTIFLFPWRNRSLQELCKKIFFLALYCVFVKYNENIR